MCQSAQKSKKFPPSLTSCNRTVNLPTLILHYILENCYGRKNDEHPKRYVLFVLSKKHEILDTIFQTTNGYDLNDKYNKN